MFRRPDLNKFKKEHECDQDCRVCYGLSVEIDHLKKLSGVLLLVLGGIIGAIIVDRAKLSVHGEKFARSEQQGIYLVQSVNDIKDALDLKIRPMRSDMNIDIRDSLPGSKNNRDLADPQSLIKDEPFTE